MAVNGNKDGCGCKAGFVEKNGLCIAANFNSFDGNMPSNNWGTSNSNSNFDGSNSRPIGSTASIVGK